MSNTNIKLKKSSVSGRIPSVGDLDYGELAINYADGKVYYKNSSNQIKGFIDSAGVQSLINSISIDSVSEATNALLLNNEDAAYYLNYNNFTNTPNVLDSADVLAISTANLSTDSAVTTQIILSVVDSDYVAGRIEPAGRVGVTEISFTADSGQSTFSTAYVPGALLVTLNGIILLNGVDYTATNGADVVLTEAADSGDTLIVTRFGGDSARIQGVVDSAYVQLQAIGLDYNVLSNTPSVVDSVSTATNALTLNGQSPAYYLDYNNFTNTPNVLDSVNVVSLITANDQQRDSAFVTNIVNAAYIQANQKDYIDSALAEYRFMDSSEVVSLVDSAYVQARQDFAYGSLTGTPNVLDSVNVQSIVTAFGYSIFDSTSFGTEFAAKSTSDLSEGTNLYYTTARHDSDFDARLSGGTGVTVSSGQVSIGQAVGTADSVTFSGMTIAGDLFVTGTTTETNTIVYTIQDPLLHLADSNEVSDTVDIGFIGHYSDDGGVSKRHTGFFRDASNSQYYLFNGLIDAGFDSTLPINTVDRNGTDFELAALNVSSIAGQYLGFDSDFNLKTVSDLSNDANYLDSTTVQGVIDASYIQSNQITYSVLDSAEVIDLVDSDYIELRRPAEAIFNVVNNGSSAYSFIGDGFSSTQDNPTLYLQRGLTYKFNINAVSHPFEIRVSDGGSAYNTGVTNNAQNNGELIFNVPMDAPDTLVYQCTIHAGMIGNIVLLSDTSFLDSAGIISLVAAQGYLTDAIDSAVVLSLIDSDYINARVDAVSGTDSASVISLINATVDSDYVQLRQSSAGGGGVTVQDEGTPLSTTATTLNFVGDGVVASGAGATKTITISGGGGGSGTVDSDYVLGVLSGANTAGAVDFLYTADSGQTVFTGADNNGDALSFIPSSIQVFVNGILLRPVIDFTTTGTNTVTLTGAADSGDEVTIFNMVSGEGGSGTVDSDGVLSIFTSNAAAVSGPTITVFEYTADSGQTTFIDSDDNGAVLSYNSDASIQLFLNGILLKNVTDYTATNGTSVVLDTAADSGDIITITSYAGAALENNESLINVFDYTAAGGQTVFSGVDNSSAIMSYTPGNIAVYLNGLFLADGVDYTATNGTSIVLTEAATADDIVSIMSVRRVTAIAATPSSNIFTYTYQADSGQTTFSGVDTSNNMLEYTEDRLQVFKNGILLIDSADYVATNGSSVTLSQGADADDYISISVATGSTEAFITNYLSASKYAEATTSITAEANKKYIVDTTQAVTITLPAIVTLGDEIRVVDGTGDASSQNITIARNGHKINGADSDFTIDIDRAAVDLAYYNVNEGWIIVGTN